MKRNFRGIWIPREIWCDKKLTWTEKIMLREIDSLNDENEGGCYASNGYFAEFFQLSKSRVSEIISSLCSKKYIRSLLCRYTERGLIKTKRLLRPSKKYLRDIEKPPSEKRKTPSESRKGYSEKAECINTDNNNIIGGKSALEVKRAKQKKVKELFKTLGIDNKDLQSFYMDNNSNTNKKS